MFNLNQKQKKIIYFIGGIIFFLVMTLIVKFYYDDPKGFEESLFYFISNFGYLGLFLAAIVANATILLPLPLDVLVLIIAGLSESFLDIILIGLIVGVGSAIGEMTAYILGYLGITSAEKLAKKESIKIREVKKRLRSSGMIFIFLGAFTPFPFDLIGIVAGIIKFDVKRFFIAASLGKIARYFLLALAGFYGIEFLKSILFF